MEKIRDAEASSSSPLATVEDIQKRLLRPSLTSQPWRDRIVMSQISSRSDANLHPVLMKKKMQAKRIDKLEDYLHPVLLSSARAKIGGDRQKFHGAETKCGAHEFDLFRWPGEGDQRELNMPTGCFQATATSRAKQEDEYSAVDLSEN